jgi:hypothetical protein
MGTILMEGLFTFNWNLGNVFSNAKGVIKMVSKKHPDNRWEITSCIVNHGDILKK